MNSKKNIKVGITGQNGFVGRHLYNYLNLQENLELIPFEREYFNSDELLGDFVSNCDTIIHLAAMNRHSNTQVIYNTNVNLVKKLISACQKANASPDILFSSSTQQSADNDYGRSKKLGGELLASWSSSSGARVVNMVIPNVFGPFGRPNYNSVVATFCHKVTHNESPTIMTDGNLKLIYINELIDDIFHLLQSNFHGEHKINHRHELKVSELLEKLLHYKKLYIDNGKFPNIDNALDLALFNTFRCYISHDHYPVPFTKHTDPRGSFVEIVRADTSGQFSFSSTVPGITRGQHFHTRKAERFAVIKGKAKISLRRIDSDEVIDYIIDGEEPAYVDMPIWHTHNITNVGDEELITLFWINEPYSSEDPDTYFVNV